MLPNRSHRTPGLRRGIRAGRSCCLQSDLQQEGVSLSELPQVLSQTARRLYGLPEEGQGGSVSLDGKSAFLANGRRMHAVPRYLSQKAALNRPSITPLTAQGRPAIAAEELLFFNGIGGFSADGREYVIRLEPDEPGRTQPSPRALEQYYLERSHWLHRFGSGCRQHMGQQQSFESAHSVAKRSCARSAQRSSLSARRSESANFWSLAPGPVAGGAAYEVRHGWGYTTYRHTRDGLVPETDSIRAPHRSSKDLSNSDYQRR